MQTANELSWRIGQGVGVKLEGGIFVVRMRIEDARSVWGKTQVKVSAVNGIGSAWVDEMRVIE